MSRPLLPPALVATVGAVTLALLGACSANVAPDIPHPPYSAAQAPLTAPQPAPTPTTTATSPSSDPWIATAEGLGQTFTRTSLGQQAWFAAMSSWLTDEQSAKYRHVPIDDIPAGQLLRADVDEPSGTRTQGLLTYDTGMVLDVGLVYVDARGGWLVSSIVAVAPGDRSGT